MDDAELRAMVERIEHQTRVITGSRVIVPVPALIVVLVLIVSLALADHNGNEHTRPWIAICAVGVLYFTWEVVTATPEGV